MQKGWKHVAIGAGILLLSNALSVAHGEDALNPRVHGDRNHEDSTVSTYRSTCNPASTSCQLPTRDITQGESDLNQRAVSGGRLGTPSPPITPREDNSVGPEIGKSSALDSTARSGRAINH